jgi:hypothetical protein
VSPLDLDNLKDLGVTILWLMPIHPIGQEKKKGTIGSPYAVVTTTLSILIRNQTRSTALD